MVRPSLQKQPQEIARMFDAVARRYDLTNDVLSAGQDRRWRRAVVQAIEPRLGERVLDLAAGTGTSSVPLPRQGAFVVPCDFSLGMVQVGKHQRPRLPFVAGDALHLPFPDAAFDVTTITFGLRNVVDRAAAMVEMLRVTRPGGRLVLCEFSQPVWQPLRTVYGEYLMKALPRLATAVSSSPESYVYLADSIRAWPDQQALAVELREAGWTRVQIRNLSGGIVALHRARRPGPEADRG
jgi:demethylmenaquinone methyltransferase/2-methoxy-6-polyprenyl-1,4-benzoquinol methylase